MIKLILSDLDNTLIPLGQPHISERTRQAIHACLDEGILFGPATGRCRAEVEGFLCFDEACYRTAVFANGHQAYLDGALVADVPLDAHDLKALETALVMRPLCALITFRDNGDADWVGDEEELLGPLFSEGMRHDTWRHEELPVYPVTKAGVIANIPTQEQFALREELLELAPHLDLTRTVDGWFDVVGKGWSKAQGAELLQRALGIGPEQTLVFGDAENDLDLFAMSAHACAVANAMPEVRSQAHHLIGAADEDGVAKALEELAAAAAKGALPDFLLT